MKSQTLSKRQAGLFFWLATVLFVMLFFIVLPVNAHAATGKTTLFTSKSWANGSRAATITKYDVTNDGKKDVVSVRLGGDSYSDCFEGLSIYVNGKRLYYKNYYGYFCKVQLLTLKNKKKFIYVEYTSDNDDGAYAILQYKSGKFKTIINQNLSKGIRHAWIHGVKVSGNSVKVTYGNSPYATGYIKCTYTFKYKKGTLKRTNSTSKSVTYFKNGKKTKSYVTTACKVKTYKSTSTKSKKTYLKKGTKVKITAIKVSKKVMWFKLKTKSGKCYWLKNPGSLLLNKGHQGTYFKEFYQAG